MVKIIVLNGAPRSGKNIGAKYLTDLVNSTEGNLVAYHREFKDELFKVAANFLGITVGEFLDGYEDTVGSYQERTYWDSRYAFQDCYDECEGDYNKFELMWMKDLKRYKIEDLYLSTREVLIHCSENVIKPLLGKDAFGKIFANNLPEDGVVFVSDSGFPEELQPVIDKVGAENVKVIRITRDGCTFENDSRDFLLSTQFSPESRPQFVDVNNNGTEPEFCKTLEGIVGGWI